MMVFGNEESCVEAINRTYFFWLRGIFKWKMVLKQLYFPSMPSMAASIPTSAQQLLNL